MKILFVGEQYSSITFELKGFDYMVGGNYIENGQLFYDSLTNNGFDVTWLKNNRVPLHFPEKIEVLSQYDVLILSDVGSNSLLLHPEVLCQSKRHPNRLKLIYDFVAGGGGLLMIGGWMSFAGIDGKARYHSTEVEMALPVTCSQFDDRVEKPEGIIPEIVNQNHQILRNMKCKWPFLLGYNRVSPKTNAATLIKVGDDPLLTIWECGKGRSAIYSSDCSPHWGSQEFMDWNGYDTLWKNIIVWLTKKS